MATPKPPVQPMFDGLQVVMSKCFFRIEAHSKNLGWQNQGFQKPGFSSTRSKVGTRYLSKIVATDQSRGKLLIFFFGKAPDMFKFLRHVMRAILSARPKVLS